MSNDNETVVEQQTVVTTQQPKPKNRWSQVHWEQFLITLLLISMVWYALQQIMTAIIPEGNQRIADIFLGYLMGVFSMAAGYWFNTTAQSAKKDDTIAKAMPVKEQ